MHDVDDPGDDLPSELEAAVYEAAFAPDAGAAKLAALCEEHPARATRLRELYDAVRGAHCALSEASAECAGKTDSAHLSAGAQLGPFTVIREIGRGAFGAVHLAEQAAPLRRLVALKVLRIEATAPELMRRFEAERQVLAQLEHPGIARIYDAGTTADRQPYFVMEFLDGTPLLKYADERCLAVQARLELFLELCVVVEHAHQRGVVHRDLKPGNVLVVANGEARQVKVIDFGLAKVLAPERLQVEPSTTEIGRLLGTPEYMSPEQASGQVVDTRADVWSLGVILFQLLTGTLPFPSALLRQQGLASVVRILCEQSAPLASASVSSEREAELRRSSVHALRRRLRGDLDLIVATCLRQDRDRRFGTVAELAADVRRHLEHQPLAVEAPRLAYVLRKLAQRHRATFAALALAVAGLLVAAIALGWSTLRVARASERLRREAYAATILAAEAQEHAGHAFALRALLAATDPNQRHIEHALLEARSEDALRVIRVPAKTPGTLVDLGSLVVRGERAFVSLESTDEVVTFDPTRPGPITRLALDLRVRRMVMSPDGRWLALSGAGGALEVRDTSTLALLRRVTTGRECGWGLAFDHDGSRLWVSLHGGIGEFDAATLRMRALHELPTEALCIAQDPEDGRVAVGCVDGEVHLLDPGDGSTTCKLRHGDQVVALCFVGPERLVSAGRDGVLRLWDLGGLTCVAAQETKSQAIHALALSADGRTMLCPHTDGQVLCFATQDLRPCGTYLGHEGLVSHAAPLRRGGWLTSSWDGTVRVWPELPPEEAEEIPSIPGSPRRLVLHPTRPLVFVACLGGSLGAYDLEQRTWKWVHVTESVEGLVLSAARGEVFATSPTALLVVDMESGLIVRSARLSEGSLLRDLRWRRQDREVVVCRDDGGWMRVDATTLEVLATTVAPPGLAPSNPYDLCILEGGSVAVLSCPEDEPMLRAFDLRDGRLLWTTESIRGPVVSLPGGERMLALASTGHVETLDARTGKAVAAPSSFLALSADLSPSTDWRRLLVTGGPVRILDLVDLRVLHTLRGRRFPIGVVAHDVDRGILVTGGGRFTDPSELLVWSLRRPSSR